MRRSTKHVASKEWLSYWDSWHKNSGPNKKIVARKTRVRLKREAQKEVRAWH